MHPDAKRKLEFELRSFVYPGTLKKDQLAKLREDWSEMYQGPDNGQQPPAPQPYRCPRCGHLCHPIQHSKVTQAGWAVFAACLVSIAFLSVVALAFCWIPLVFMREKFWMCSRCKKRWM